MQATLEAPTTTTTAVAPLNVAEGDALLMTSASLEHTTKVTRGQSRPAESRAWTRGARID